MRRRDFERLRKLRKLQRLGMSAAEDLHARAKAEKDPKRLLELADSLLLLGEEIRQAIALEAKLARDMEAGLPPPLARARRRRPARPDPRLAAEPPTPTRH